MKIYPRRRRRTIRGLPAPLHLPAVRDEHTAIDLAPAFAADDAVVVDVAIDAEGRLVIVGEDAP